MRRKIRYTTTVYWIPPQYSTIRASNSPFMHLYKVCISWVGSGKYKEARPRHSSFIKGGSGKSYIAGTRRSIFSTHGL